MKPEEALQRQVAAYLNVALRPPHFWTAFPSGWFKGKVIGGILKACGLRPGCPDLLFIHGDTGKAFWIELKAEGGTLSPNQKETHAALSQAHCPVVTCRSLEAVEITLKAWGFNIMARAA